MCQNHTSDFWQTRNMGWKLKSFLRFISLCFGGNWFSTLSTMWATVDLRMGTWGNTFMDNHNSFSQLTDKDSVSIFCCETRIECVNWIITITTSSERVHWQCVCIWMCETVFSCHWVSVCAGKQCHLPIHVNREVVAVMSDPLPHLIL